MLPSIPTLSLYLQALSLFSLASTATVRLSIPPSPQIPNPAILPASTHATLTTLGASHVAPLTTDNTFVFRNVTPGSYLGDVHCPTHGFAPLRVDIIDENNLRVWETYRGNDWENKGEEMRPAGNVPAFPVKVLGSKIFYTERSSCELLSLFPSLYVFILAYYHPFRGGDTGKRERKQRELGS